MNVKPLSDRILVSPQEASKVTATGIIIPDTVVEKPQIGTVVAHGPGKSEQEPIGVKVGDNIMFAKHSGTKIVVEGKEYLFMREGDVWAIINPS